MAPPPPPLLKLITIVFILTQWPIISGATMITYSFPSFNRSTVNDLMTLISDAPGLSFAALQVTPDTTASPSLLQHKSGRILLSRPFRLWRHRSGNTTTTVVASFSTIFSINVYRVDSAPGHGEGMAFLIAPSLSPVSASSGAYLGLTSPSTDGDASNSFVAVEFDTKQEPSLGDVDDNHLGLDLNSVRSNVSVPLSPFNITIAPVAAANWTVWIDYNGTARRISVFMAAMGKPKPAAPVLNSTLDLSQVVPEHAYFGFSASTGDDYELNCVLSWDLAVDYLPDDDDSAASTGWKIGLAIAVPVASVAVLVAALCLILLGKRKRARARARMADDEEPPWVLPDLPGIPRELMYKDLCKATENFSEKNKLGQGGYGVVFRGVLLDQDADGGTAKEKEVAVKRFNGGAASKDFIAELSIINRLRHRNLVGLVGWCHRNGVLLLVYDYMPNGSLDQHLFGDRPPLPWSVRYNIVAGVAAALRYLHREYDQVVVHRDIKPSNIMLDSEFGAKLGDFGLARAVESDMTSYAAERSGVTGTPGYIALECFHTGKATCESDIYAFGAVVLEVVCGRRLHGEYVALRNPLVEWVWTLHGEGRILEAVDPKLVQGGGFDCEEDDARRLLLLGLACCHPSPEERPDILSVVQILGRSADPPAVPPVQPPFMWPAVQDMGAYRRVLEMTTTTTTAASSGMYSAASTRSWTSDSPLLRPQAQLRDFISLE